MVNKVVVSIRAIEARLNRSLARKGRRLCKARYYPGGWENSNLGRYYIIDQLSNTLVDRHVKLNVLAEEYGVIREWESIED